MKTTLTRLFTVMLLIMVSLGAKADVKVLFGEKGDDKVKTDGDKIEAAYDGGTIVVTQKVVDATKVTVFLTVTPNKGYTMQEKNVIEAYATAPANIGKTRAPEVSEKITFDCKDFKDEYSARTYYVDIDPTLALWVKNATFEQNKRDDSKAVGDTAPEYYYIANYKSYNANDHTKSYYICPAINPDNTSQAEYYDTDMPFLTTYKTNQNDESLWMVKWVKDEGGKKYYNIIHSKDGYYLIYNPVVTPSNDSRLRVHIQLTSTNDDNALFEIKAKDSYYYIHPKNDINRSLNPSKGNKDSYVATNDSPVDGRNIGGMLGLWADNEDGRWYLESPASSITAAPVVTNNFDGTITITAAEGNIYYTTDRTTAPTTSLTAYSSPCVINLTDNVTFIRAIAMVDGKERSAMINYALPKCEKPIITESDGIVTIVCATTGAEIYYTTDGTDPSDPDNSPTKYLSSFSLSESSPAVRAIAIGGGYITSEESYYTHPAIVHNSSAMTVMNGNYKLASDFVISRSIGTESDPFCGIIDGELNTVSGAQYPLVAYADGATIKNVILDNVSIGGNNHGNAGAICCEAKGKTIIYNCGVLATETAVDAEGNDICSSNVSGSNYVGGIVGLLDGSSRVINCFSYANIISGTEKAGIVGHNNYASTFGDIRTMVMNCMFYGDIVTGGTISPIYGGLEINNEGTNSSDGRLNNYNYFRVEAPFSKNNKTVNGVNTIITTFNRALSAEERYLNRFEFYRYLLNSNRELAAAYIDDTPTETGTGANLVKRYHKEKMAKWVLDKSIAPYPILKEPGIYPSVVNYDPQYTNDETGVKVLRSSVSERNKGKELGSVTVTISGVGANAPSAAKLVDENGDETTYRTITLYRTDKDYINFNYNYDKIQLPYYNEVGKGNYTGNMVVTGWKVRTSSKAKSFGTANYDYPNYNLADRSCIEGRVFSQGAYFDVPEGTNSISIEPYWGNAVYVSDGYHDSYSNDNDYSPQGLEDFGKKYVDNQLYYINPNDNSDANNQKVYTSISTAVGKLSNATSVYDNAVVLVGNFHCKGTPSTGSKPFTIMSADLDHDNEPDYSLIIRSGKQEVISPIRFDFINVPGVVMAHKKTSTTQMGILGNMKPKGWFEVTNTAVIRFSQMEYDYESKSLAPLILLGGVVEQFVSTNSANGKTSACNTEYIHLGSNVWVKLFSNGCHMDKTAVPTSHRPISVTGGEYEKFYLSGYFQPDAPVADNADDRNAECYIDGGKFGEVAGAGQELVDGNVTWVVNHADIESFFGGGINDAKAITGNINVTIKNSHVGLYCGGPKFGNMAGVSTPDNLDDDKTVTTTAVGSTFGNFYGAGYGGTAIYRDIWSPGADGGHNRYTLVNYDWMDWLGDDRGYSDDHTPTKTRGQYVAGKGIAVGFETEQFEGSATATVARLYVNFATLSVAKTNGVTSNLTGCTINQNFFGGGNLGSVNGNINSTLTNCKVYGSVFGAGCSATVPTADVYDSPTTANFTGTSYNTNTGVFEPTDYPNYVEYTWSNTEGNNSDKTLVEKDIEGSTEKEYWIHVDYDANTGTGINLNELGVVKGTVTVNLEGNTLVMGKIFDEDGNETGAQTGGVFGGGDASATQGDTEVNINTTSTQSAGYNANIVYGGGNEAEVRGDTEVNLHNGVINGNVFGGGNKGVVSGTATVNIE